MFGLDIVVLALVGLLGLLGFKRGFVAEALTLVAWIAAVLAVKLLFDPVSAALEPRVGTASGAAALAVIALFLVTLILGKYLAGRIGRRSRASILGPFDRVLGFGFGALKGLIAATLIFLVVTIGIDAIYGPEDRPSWLEDARTYPLLRASSGTLVDLVRERDDEPIVRS